MFKLKKLSKRILALTVASSLLLSICPIIRPTKALAVGTPVRKTLSGELECLTQTIQQPDGTYKRISNPTKQAQPKEFPEINIQLSRLGRTYYYLPIRTQGCGAGPSGTIRGYVMGAKQSNTWDVSPGGDPNVKPQAPPGENHPQGYMKGYNILKQPNYKGIRSLWYNGQVPNELPRCTDGFKSDGSDFLNKDHVKDTPDGTWTIHIKNSFDTNIEFSATDETIANYLGIDPNSKLFRPNHFVRKAYMERRIGKENNCGINYTLYKDFTIQFGADFKNGQCYNFPLGNCKKVGNTYYYISGIYGNEEFNYYTPKMKIQLYDAEYEKIDDTIPPPPPDTTGCGRIEHNPNKTKWTNRGKISNGKGDYEVDVRATLPRLNLTGETESHKHSTKKGSYCYCTRTFNVKYDIDRIESSGATNDTVSGSHGTVHIRQEGEGQEIDSIGKWGRAQYTARYAHGNTDSCDVPDPPCEPQGHAGKYDIDWTDPVIQVQQKAPSKWRNNPYYQPIDISITDNLSGFDSNKSYIKITDISHYSNNYFINLNDASLNDVNHWDLADGIYKIDIVVYDRAGNNSEYHDQWFKVDGIPPDITISDQGYHRHIDSLTFDTTVSDNIEELDELTVSGWGTYGSEKAKLANQTEVVRPITYPHIKHEDTNYTFYYKVEDLAGNQTTKKFVTSVVREYWKWAHTTYGSDFDTEIPIKILSNKDTKSLAGFTKSKTIDFDKWRGMPVEVWYKFKDHYNVNFIRVIHYDNPNLPIITGNGVKLYPDGKGSFKDAPPLSNEIGLEVGTDEYVESFGKATDPMPIKVVDNDDGTMTNYYVNGDIRRIDKATGQLITTKDKSKYGIIIPDSIHRGQDKIVYHTTTRYKIEVIFGEKENTVRITDKNNNVVEETKIRRANA